MASGERPQKGAWGITALIFLFMLINFADKVVVGLAAEPIKKELNLTPEEFGFLGSSFFFLFAVAGVAGGFLANRAQTRHLLFTMAIVWSVVQFPMLGAVTLEVLIVCRIVLGAGEGPAGPIALHALYKWFPDSLRGVPTALVAQGSALGVIIAVPALNYIIVNYSWHWAFGALGIVGLLWAVAWLFLGREGTLVDPPVAAGADTGDRVPYRHLLTCPTIIAACCVAFASYWGLALGLTWFVAYLVEGLGYTQTVAGYLFVLPWLFGMVVVLTGGWLSQRLKKQGVSSRVCRGAFPAATVVVGGCILPFIASVPDPGVKVALLVVGSAIGSTVFVCVPMIVSELTPQSQRAAMLAIATSIYTSAGVIAPWAMGRVIQEAANRQAGYEQGFVILGGLLLAGGLIGLLFTRPEAARVRLAAKAGVAITSPLPRSA